MTGKSAISSAKPYFSLLTDRERQRGEPLADGNNPEAQSTISLRCAAPIVTRARIRQPPLTRLETSSRDTTSRSGNISNTREWHVRDTERLHHDSSALGTLAILSQRPCLERHALSCAAAERMTCKSVVGGLLTLRHRDRLDSAGAKSHREQ
jgi:hypothetical protein